MKIILRCERVCEMWTGVSFRVYSCPTLGVPGTGSESTSALARIKRLLRDRRMNEQKE